MVNLCSVFCDGRQEKDDTLALTLAIGNILERNGVDVYYTRTTDIYKSPYQKAQEGNEVICTPFTGHPVKGVFLCVTVTNSNERQSNYTGKGNGLNHQQTSQT